MDLRRAKLLLAADKARREALKEAEKIVEEAEEVEEIEIPEIPELPEPPEPSVEVDGVDEDLELPEVP